MSKQHRQRKVPPEQACIGDPPWTVERARAFLQACGAPVGLWPADEALYAAMRDALLEQFKPTCAMEALLVRDLTHNELQIRRLDQLIERAPRHHEAAGVQQLADSFYPVRQDPRGRYSYHSDRLEPAAMAACARRDPDGMRAVGEMLVEARLDAADVSAATLGANIDEFQTHLRLRAACEARRRALMQDIAEWRRGGLGAPPQVMARCERALKDVLAAYGLR